MVARHTLEEPELSIACVCLIFPPVPRGPWSREHALLDSASTVESTDTLVIKSACIIHENSGVAMEPMVPLDTSE